MSSFDPFSDAYRRQASDLKKAAQKHSKTLTKLGVVVLLLFGAWSAYYQVEPEELANYQDQPATLITTVVTLPNTDVRQVSNSMRTMITDANTQQMLPAGNSSSMVLVGFGDTIRDLVDTLLTVDARSAAEGAAANRLNEVIRLENSRATELAGLLQRALGLSLEQPQASDPKILSDERSNSLIVSATAERLASIKALIAALDAK